MNTENSKTTVLIPTNKYQTPITQELLDLYPSEVQEQFLDVIDTIPLVKYMVGNDRKRACELPRDAKGRIIVDVTHPHILENMEYFRPAGNFYKENGCYTLLKPNPNKNSEYGKWLSEEFRRCLEGYVRESDGEWVTGYMYWYLNYNPILLNRKDEDSGIYVRSEDFPDFWEGIYYRFHYIYQARMAGKHCMELARRGAGKSYSLAALMSHNLILGENSAARKRIVSILTAYTKEYLSDKDGTFTKFTPMLDFVSERMEFPKLFLKRSSSEMIWRMGYKNANKNELGSLNSVMGLSTRDDEGKIRGKRGYILFEEMGNFPNFKEVWNNVRDSVKEGSHVFSLLFAVGTAGDDASDFSGVQTIMYHPSAFEILALDNVYDRRGKGAKQFVYFFPSYISRAGCMDKDGNSDVVKALLEILKERWIVKQSGDAKSLLSRTAQMPITPEEAILKVSSNYFPVTMLNERLRQIDMDSHFFDDVYVGTLIEVVGHVEFRATDDVPLRKWHEDNSSRGAVEIYEMPQTPIPNHRYIIGHDPVDNDQAESTSFSSTIVFDMFTDRIVAEYTGRLPFADDNFEILRLLALFYNATVMVEANKKGYYSYFARKHSVHLLADCPDYLRDKQLIKYSAFGSAQKGVTVNAAVIGFANSLIKDWLNKAVPVEVKDEHGETSIQTMPLLYTIRDRALLEELIGYSPEVNTDRVSALAQVMLYREQYRILYGDGSSPAATTEGTEEDEFFKRDWEHHLAQMSRFPGKFRFNVADFSDLSKL